ncbi:hypothetical protein KBC75_00700 [Candidatus Shapirobacteria bacterium]|nr:hypothetical protein [Candidatus Shapirobacteria bacterium]
MKKYLTSLFLVVLFFVYKTTTLATDSTTVVTPGDMATSISDVISNPLKWFFYNDENDTIDNSLGSFVAGPSTPPLGSDSIQINVTGTQRRNLATYQFSGTPLSDITTLKFSTYNPSVGNGGSANRSGYLNFNVDFNGSDTWQRRLVFVPSQNGTVVQNSWQEWDAISGGNALWAYSGANWPATIVGPDANLSETGDTLRSWSDIKSDYPGVRIRVTDSWLGVRVGEPYADGYTENIDAFKFGTVSSIKTFDFDLVNEPSSVAVHIFKYIDGVQATTQSANSVDFPMFTSTYNAPFILGPAGWTTGDLPYEASTGPMSVGSAYSAEEKLDTPLVGTTCDGAHQYSLTGYSTGNSLSEAELSETTTTVPTFTNLTGDKYIIVKNHLCPPVSTLKVHILKYLDGTKASALSANNYLFPMTATWLASNLNGGLSASGNYVLGNNFGGAVDLYGADTAIMNAPADYTTSELTNVTSAVVADKNSCTPGKYLLNGYRTSALSFADAALNPLLAIAPVFTGITTDRYIIVDNSHCPEASSISGQKYNDLNRNGKKDTNEPGLPGWVIRLKVGKTTFTATTDADGKYSFINLIPGKYTLRETHQKGWKRISKNPKPIVITSGSVVTSINFGNAQKYRFEKEDDNRDDDRDDERGEYSPGRGHRDYERDSRH